MASRAKARTEQWLFTFGFGHVHPETGGSLSGRCVRFNGSYAEARREMVQRFGIKWAFQYACDAAIGADPRELTEAELPEAIERASDGSPLHPSRRGEG